MSHNQQSGKDDFEYDICVVGSCVQDVVAYTSRFPKPGESVRGSSFKLNCGGKGANQAVTAARLGVRVAMVAMVGKDMFGDGTVANFKAENVQTDYVFQTSEAATGAANIFVEDSGENCIVVVLGANLLLTVDHVKQAEKIIASSKVLLCQFEIEPSVSLEAMKIARKHGVKTIINPAPGLQNVDREIYQFADIICPNENEAEIMTGRSITNIDNAIDCIGAIRSDLSSTSVIITLGSKGCVFQTKDMDTPEYLPAVEVKAVDTVGAGDSFVGSLAFFVATLPQLSLSSQIARANQIASVSVQRPGTQPSYAKREELPAELFTL